MKKFIFNIQKSKTLLIIFSFVAGTLFSFLIIDYIGLKFAQAGEKKQLQLNTPGEIQYKDPFEQQFKEMQKRMDRIFKKSYFSDDFFTHNFPRFNINTLSNNDLKINQREDDEFSYIEIESKGIKQNELNIKIENGMINISGTIEKEEQNQQQGSISSSKYISKFQRSFNVPHGVDESRMDVKTKDDKIIIKFPKTIKI